jgi:hypothetical protein
LNKQVGYKTAAPVRLGVLPSVHMRTVCRIALYMGLRSQLHKLEVIGQMSALGRSATSVRRSERSA